jgi:hypothetical protein
MKLQVKTLQANKSYYLEVPNDGTTDDLQIQIEKEIGIELSAQKLIFAGSIIKQTRALRDLGLNEKSFFVVMGTAKKVEPIVQPVIQPIVSVPVAQPVLADKSSAFPESVINDLCSMGYHRTRVLMALEFSAGSPDRAAEILMDPSIVFGSDTPVTFSSNESVVPEPVVQTVVQPQPIPVVSSQSIPTTTTSRPSAETVSNAPVPTISTDSEVPQNLFSLANASATASKSKQISTQLNIPPHVLAQVCREGSITDIDRMSTIAAIILSNGIYLNMFINLYIGLNPMVRLMEDQLPEKINTLMHEIPKAIEYIMGIFTECPDLLKYFGTEELMVHMHKKYSEADESDTDTELTEEDNVKIEQMLALGFTREEVVEIYLECGRNAEIASAILFQKKFNDF